jgi:hypothetical protein
MPEPSRPTIETVSPRATTLARGAVLRPPPEHAQVGLRPAPVVHRPAGRMHRVHDVRLKTHQPAGGYRRAPSVKPRETLALVSR